MEKNMPKEVEPTCIPRLTKADVQGPGGSLSRICPSEDCNAKALKHPDQATPTPAPGITQHTALRKKRKDGALDGGELHGIIAKKRAKTPPLGGLLVVTVAAPVEVPTVDEMNQAINAAPAGPGMAAINAAVFAAVNGALAPVNNALAALQAAVAPLAALPDAVAALQAAVAPLAALPDDVAATNVRLRNLRIYARNADHLAVHVGPLQPPLKENAGVGNPLPNGGAHGVAQTAPGAPVGSNPLQAAIFFPATPMEAEHINHPRIDTLSMWYNDDFGIVPADGISERREKFRNWLRGR